MKRSHYSIRKRNIAYRLKSSSVNFSCYIFARSCTVNTTDVQRHTSSVAPLKWMEPSLWTSISLLVNLWCNEVDSIHDTQPYRKQDNEACDMKMILSAIFMNYIEQQQQKNIRWSVESETYESPSHCVRALFPLDWNEHETEFYFPESMTVVGKVAGRR
jgi:hypothetical protein